MPAASNTVKVTVEVPTLKNLTPKKFIPVNAEAAVVAPLIDQISLTIVQLSENAGLFVVRVFPHNALLELEFMFPPHAIVGVVESNTVTLNEHEAEFPPRS